MPFAKPYDLIIFDCDGTLVDSEPVTNSLVAKMIGEYGISISAEECLEKFAGKTIMDIIGFIQAIDPTMDPLVFEKDYRQRSIISFQEHLQPIPGAKEFISTLNIPYCVASNGPKVKMEVTLPATGLHSFFTNENVFSAYDIQAWKPEPDLFIHAAEKMNVDRKKALVIEDTWSGVTAAIRAGIDVWALNPHMDQRLYLTGIPNFSSMRSIQQAFELVMDR